MKHTLHQRLMRLLSDAATDPDMDIRARWGKVAVDFPEVEAAIGAMPDATLDDIPTLTAIEYAGRDADATLRIYPYLANKVAEMQLERALAIDLAVVPMLAAMQQNGMLVDKEHLAALSAVFEDTLATLEFRMNELADHPFNPASGDQVATVLFDELGLGGGRKTKSRKRYSTDEKTLDSLAGQHPIIALLKEHREVSKLKGTYVDVLPGLISPDGRIRMELGMTTIPSGRLNCWGGVNLLGIPVRTELGREIRRAFVAPEGCKLGAVDLNQIELRGLAVLSGDEHLLEAYAHGEDLHRNTAADAIYHCRRDSVTFEQRQRGKVTNFAVANQISALGLRDQFYISGVLDTDESECQRMLDGWYSWYSGVRPWYESVYSEGRRQGFVRCPLSGRILWTPGLRTGITGTKGDAVRGQAERVATNFLLQTYAQTIGKVGMAEVWTNLRCSDLWKPLLYVHDELLVEVDPTVEWSWGDELIAMMVQTELAEAQPIPIKAGWHEGATWADLK